MPRHKMAFMDSSHACVYVCCLRVAGGRKGSFCVWGPFFYALCVSCAVNKQFLCGSFYTPCIHFQSFIHTAWTRNGISELSLLNVWAKYVVKELSFLTIWINLMLHAQSTIEGKTNCTATTSTIRVHCLLHMSLVMVGDVWKKMKLNESGRQRQGKYSSPGTACKAIFRPTPGIERLQETLTALSTYCGNGGGGRNLNFCICDTTLRDTIWTRNNYHP